MSTHKIYQTRHQSEFVRKDFLLSRQTQHVHQWQRKTITIPTSSFECSFDKIRKQSPNSLQGTSPEANRSDLFNCLLFKECFMLWARWLLKTSTCWCFNSILSLICYYSIQKIFANKHFLQMFLIFTCWEIKNDHLFVT